MSELKPIIATEKKLERESGVELLRILAACGVIVLHYNYYGGAMSSAQGLNYGVLSLLESATAVSVNIFLLISGYFSCTRKSVSVAKVIRLLAQVIGFQLATNILSGIHGHNIRLRSLLASLLPLNYYVTFYLVLYLLSPYLHKLLGELSRSELKRLLLLLFGVFSLYQCAVDVLERIAGRELMGMSPVALHGGQSGYTVVNFLLVYCIGACLRLSELPKRLYLHLCLGGYALCTLLVWLWSFADASVAWAYCNPILILEAVFLFLAALKIHFQSKIVNILAKSSFTCYLLNIPLVVRVGTEVAAAKSAPLMLIHLLVSVIGIYLLCWIVDIVYTAITCKAFAALEKKLPSYETEG